MPADWDILIIGGASGSGKTSVSRPLAELYGVDLVRVDDFQCLLEAIISPEMIPSLHYWKIEPNWRNESVEWVVDRLKGVSRAWLPGLAAVIKDRLEENIPMILEGDFILPELAASFNNPRIKTIFIHESSREQILQNYFSREGTHQEHRANVSYAFGNWLKESCEKHNVPVAESRPWDSILERVIEMTANEKTIYRVLERGEIRKLDEIDRYEIVEEVYYFNDGKLALKKEYKEFIDISDISEVIGDYIEDYDDGGTFIGAFDGEKLVGLGGMGGSLIGENKNMIQLTSLWVSNKYRKKGIGRQLVSMLKEKAKQMGAEKLYVSAAPSKNTVDFYRGTGFELTTPIKEFFEAEPKDIHMDMIVYALKP